MPERMPKDPKDAYTKPREEAPHRYSWLHTGTVSCLQRKINENACDAPFFDQLQHGEMPILVFLLNAANARNW